MTQTSSPSAILTRRYVTALLDSAEASGLQRDLAPAVRDLAALVEKSPDLQRVLSSPLIGVIRQQRAVVAVLQTAKVDRVLQGFVSVVLQNRRGAFLLSFLQAALVELDRRGGIEEVDVQVAAPLNDLQQKKLGDMLARQSGRKIRLNVMVLPELLGGVKIRMGSMQIDDSITGKLARLRANLFVAGKH